MNYWIEITKPHMVDLPFCKGCQVEQGFMEMYNSIAGSIYDELVKMDCAGKPLIASRIAASSTQGGEVGDR